MNLDVRTWERGAPPRPYRGGAAWGGRRSRPPAVFGFAEYGAPHKCADCTTTVDGGVLAEWERRRGD